MAMEKQLSFVLKLTLEELALRRVTVNLCNGTDVLSSIAKFRFESAYPGEDDTACQSIVDLIKDKVSRLVLPEFLKQRMIHLIRPLVLEILEWKVFHNNFFRNSVEHFDRTILKQMCWTCVGSVDYQKTAERLVRIETLDVVKRYELACLYCLLDDIPVLWEELPDEVKRAEIARYPALGRDTYLEYYWAQYMKGKDADISSTYLKDISFLKKAFEFAACTGNVAATKYFFEKLNNGKQDSFVIRTIHFIIAERCRNVSGRACVLPKKKLSKVLCYLLSMLRPENQMQALKACRCEILGCFLDWPLQDLFLGIADVIWTSLPDSKYHYLLDELTTIIKESGYYFPNLIQEFFLRSPRDFKVRFVSKLIFFLTEFLYAEDRETLLTVLRNVDLGNRRALVSGAWFPRFVSILLRSDNRHLVKLCIREISLSKEEEKILMQNATKFSSESRRDIDIFFGPHEDAILSELEHRLRGNF